jgi:hypothetical protein
MADHPAVAAGGSPGPLATLTLPAPGSGATDARRSCRSTTPTKNTTFRSSAEEPPSPPCRWSASCMWACSYSCQARTRGSTLLWSMSWPRGWQTELPHRLHDQLVRLSQSHPPRLNKAGGRSSSCTEFVAVEGRVDQRCGKGSVFRLKNNADTAYSRDVECPAALCSSPQTAVEQQCESGTGRQRQG